MGVPDIINIAIAILTGACGFFLLRLVNQVDDGFKEINTKMDTKFDKTDGKLDTKVIELTHCLARIEEQIALNEQETEGLSKNIGSILKEIGEIKDNMSAISTQYESLKSNHAFLRLEYERQGKRLEELENKVNKLYYTQHNVG